MKISTAILLAALLCGCATTQQPDPLEPVNRKVFAFNEGVDRVVLQPVARGYAAVLPQPVRTGIGNVFSNADDLWSAVNLFLQGRPADGLSDVMRFGTNTLFGVLGVFDVATPMGMTKHGEDLGQTLGRWGVANGAYLVWPLLGPSTLRDSVGSVGDLFAAPQAFITNVPLRNSLRAVEMIDTRAGLLATTRLVDDIALDKYLFVRDAYLQRRRSLVHDGDAPELNAATAP